MSAKKISSTIVLAACLFCSCTSHPSFKNSTEAIEACKAKLTELQSYKDADIEKVADLTSQWQELQDSSYSVFSKDSTINLKSPIAMAYFVISDSIRTELTRLAFSQQRSLQDVMYLKLNTASDREKIQKSDTYKKASEFYEKLDKEKTIKGLERILGDYNKLLNKTRTFEKEAQLLSFIQREDRCFRSLMEHLSNVPMRDMQRLTQETSGLFNRLYDSVGKKSDEINDRTMLYLTMRFNRRIMQNAIACREDILNNNYLNNEQRVSYRWMLIQPYVSMDEYSTSVLTKKQREELMILSKELPVLLNRLDNQKKTKKEEDKLVNTLADYFLKSYISSTL
ncbi:hypothetical protein [Prevotella nigrescens]|uniref:hypothetical protein n=1 Tax=Prevotella nigrescens TaxID=28133 RepID=UPI0028DD25BF|nr:hypothetical protein [Prevotella nigrescens]